MTQNQTHSTAPTSPRLFTPQNPTRGFVKNFVQNLQHFMAILFGLDQAKTTGFDF